MKFHNFNCNTWFATSLFTFKLFVFLTKFGKLQLLYLFIYEKIKNLKIF